MVFKIIYDNFNFIISFLIQFIFHEFIIPIFSNFVERIKQFTILITHCGYRIIRSWMLEIKILLPVRRKRVAREWGGRIPLVSGLIRYRPSRLAFLFLWILISATFVVSRPFVFTVATIFTLVAVSRGKPETLEIILSLRKDIFRR